MIELWQWYWSADGERFHGPFTSREEAIEEGRESDEEGVGFEIVEATKGRLQTAIFRDLDQKLDDANEDNGDPDGETIAAQVTDVEWLDLETRLNDAIAKWADVNVIHKLVWTFATTRNRESIVI